MNKEIRFVGPARGRLVRKSAAAFKQLHDALDRIGQLAGASEDVTAEFGVLRSACDAFITHNGSRASYAAKRLREVLGRRGDDLHRETQQVLLLAIREAEDLHGAQCEYERDHRAVRSRPRRLRAAV